LYEDGVMSYDRWGRWQPVSWEKRVEVNKQVPVNRAAAITAFCFGDLDGDASSKVDSTALIKLTVGGERLDTAIRNKFGHFLQYFTANKLTDWEGDALGAVALTVLLDIFPRRMFRGTRRQFAYDPEARRVAINAIKNGLYDSIGSPVLRLILLGPLRNSEDIKLQEFAKALFDQILVDFATHPNIGIIRSSQFLFDLSLAAIKKFGRFPDRNELLGRPSKVEEVKSLYDGTVMNGEYELKRSERMRIAGWESSGRKKGAKRVQHVVTGTELI